MGGEIVELFNDIFLIYTKCRLSDYELTLISTTPGHMSICKTLYIKLDTWNSFIYIFECK